MLSQDSMDPTEVTSFIDAVPSKVPFGNIEEGKGTLCFLWIFGSRHSSTLIPVKFWLED